MDAARRPAVTSRYVAVDLVSGTTYYGPGTHRQAAAYARHNNRAEPGVWRVRTLSSAIAAGLRCRGRFA